MPPPRRLLEPQSPRVALRDRIDGDLGFMTVDDAITKLSEERDTRQIRQVIKSDFKGFAGGSDEAENEY